MADLSSYDVSSVQPMSDREPIPAGVYLAAITASKVKQTKKGDGEILSLEWTILEGECEKRKVFSNINLQNPNAQAVEIGMRELRTVKEVLGQLNAGLSEELHNIPAWIKVKIVPAKDGFPEKNEIAKYAPVEEQAATTAPTKPAPTAARPAPARQQPAMAGAAAGGNGNGGKKPWQR